MTHVEMIYEHNIIIGFRMEGHAGFNTKGPDILCAALSTASQMTINGILDWTELSLEDVITEADEQKGILHFEIPLFIDIGQSITTQQLFRSFELYVEQLAEQYSEYVSLERRQKVW